MADTMMDVSEAVASRLSVRDFLPTPVPDACIRRVLEKALRAPSGGNVQPWHIHVVNGERLKAFKAIMAQRVVDAPSGDGTQEYAIYPEKLMSPYRERRFAVGEQMYGTMGIAREQRDKRLAWFARNYQFFGAPCALFFSLDKRMGPPQWSDMGMLIQTIMLLLRSEGLHSCPQEAWARYNQTVAEFIRLPDELMLFCGMAIGHINPDHAVNGLRSERASIDDVVTFVSEAS